MDQLPEDFHDWGDTVEVLVQLVATDNPATENRVVVLQDLTDTFGELALTWNTQPGVETGDIGNDEATGDTLRYDLLDVTQIVPTSGPWPLRLKDDVEDDDSLEGPFEQELAAREHDTLDPAVFHAEYQAHRDTTLASGVHVGPKHARLAATVKPGTQPLAGKGRAVGRVVYGFVDPLRDLELISAKAGSRLTLTQDGVERALTRIVQLVRSRKGHDFPRRGSSQRERLQAGDAVLFAHGDDGIEPGAAIAWAGRDWKVAGVLAVERVDGVAIYREIGLRRNGILDHARASGTVQAASEGQLRWCFVTVRQAAHADLDAAVDVETTL